MKKLIIIVFAFTISVGSINAADSKLFSELQGKLEILDQLRERVNRVINDYSQADRRGGLYMQELQAETPEKIGALIAALTGERGRIGGSTIHTIEIPISESKLDMLSILASQITSKPEDPNRPWEGTSQPWIVNLEDRGDLESLKQMYAKLITILQSQFLVPIEKFRAETAKELNALQEKRQQLEEASNAYREDSVENMQGLRVNTGEDD